MSTTTNPKLPPGMTDQDAARTIIAVALKSGAMFGVPAEDMAAAWMWAATLNDPREIDVYVAGANVLRGGPRR